MLKKFLTAACLLTITATPVQAFPIWAEAIARDHCEYLELGAEWDVAIEQALIDNRHWMPEMQASPIASKLAYGAIRERCGQRNIEAFRQYKSEEAQPAINTQWR